MISNIISKLKSIIPTKTIKKLKYTVIIYDNDYNIVKVFSDFNEYLNSEFKIEEYLSSEVISDDFI